MEKFKFFILLFLVVTQCAWSQETIISGKITDAKTGDALPFVNIYFSGTSIGTSSDFEGYYKIKTPTPSDSLTASYIGYMKRSKIIKKGVDQTVNFQLESDVVNLKEVVFYAGENPAYEVIRRAINNKAKNDKRSLSAYEHDSYNKIEIAMDNMSEKFRQRKIMQKVSRVLDSIDQVAGEDGKPILPFFISESISKVYFRTSPKLQKEEILKTKISGIGVEDGSIVSQLIGSSFQEYNFYQNWLNILEKEFVSPLADGWKTFYDFDLVDSVNIDGYFCYQIDVKPKRDQDLAFNGTMWIDKQSYALKQASLSINKSANLNYIEGIKIQQELLPTEAGAWLPVKARIVIDVAEISKDAAGMLAKFYTSNKNFVVNNPKNPKFYENRLQVAEDVNISNSAYWELNRPDSITETEKNVYAMIDTLKNIPVVKTYVDIVQIAASGYKSLGTVDIGPYLLTYANNNIEGHRLQVGLRTNIKFSSKWILKGFAAYGTNDQEFKYSAGVTRILNRKPWSTVGIEYKRDIGQVGLNLDDLYDNNFIFYSFSRFGTLVRPYYSSSTRIKYQADIKKGITGKVTASNFNFDPLYLFGYYTSPQTEDSSIKETFHATEVTFELRFARDELFIQNDNERISLGAAKWPVATLSYTLGLKDVLGSEFHYNKLGFNITQRLNMGLLGISRYTIDAGYIFDNLPYPLLKVHQGNESPFYTTAAYNLMNYFEFVSDSYISLRYNHYFEGFLTNSVPLLKKLKWRLVGTASVLYGNARRENLNVIPDFDSNGKPIQKFQSLGELPYVEVGYGIENIFKVLRIDAFHRLTYANDPGVSKFGLKFSLQFIL